MLNKRMKYSNTLCQKWSEWVVTANFNTRVDVIGWLSAKKWKRKSKVVQKCTFFIVVISKILRNNYVVEIWNI